MRWNALLALALLLAPAAAAEAMAQGQGQGQGRPTPEQVQERRARLERQVRTRFIEQASRQLGLDGGQRERLDAVLGEGAGSRRELARESQRLRARLVEAVRDDATAAASFEALLRDMDRLRQRELELERREQARLAEFLDPRQRAGLVALRMRLNEQVRRMQGTPGRRRNPPGG